MTFAITSEPGAKVESTSRRTFLPDNQYSRLPVLTHGAGSVSQSEFANEREILYKLFFDMKKDVNELKKMFYDLLQNPNIPMHNAGYDGENAGKELAAAASGNFVPANNNTAAVYFPVNRENIQQHEEVEESLSIVDKEKELIIKALKKHDQITKHNCIQGWTAVAEWGGLPMSDVIQLCKPKSNAKYVLFHCYDTDDQNRAFYSGLRLEDMYDEQTILAYEMNGKTLPIEYGAPLRLRCEKKYGYKMAKYIKSIEFVESFEKIGEGRGGYREDIVFFDWEASI